MPVVETPVDTWRDHALRFKKNLYPICGDRNAPKMYFVGLFVGARGTGKTYAICKLLKHYERVGFTDPESGEEPDQRVVLFSPTSEANPVFTSLRHLDMEEDVITNYSDAKLVSVINDIRARRDDTKAYQEKLKVWRKFVRSKKMDKFSQDELTLLASFDYDFDNVTKPIHPHGCVVYLIFDDLIGSDAFKAVGRSALTNLVLKNRHLGCNVLIAAQSLRSIPKPIRSNTSLYVLFRFANQKIVLDDLYEEVSNILQPPTF